MDAYPHLSQPIGAKPIKRETQKECSMVEALLSYFAGFWVRQLGSLLATTDSFAKTLSTALKPNIHKTIITHNNQACGHKKTRQKGHRRLRSLLQTLQLVSCDCVCVELLIKLIISQT